MGKEEKKAKRDVKDCVFSDFFGMSENLLKLYQTLHPEDENVGVDDLKDVTIQNVLVNDLYNDLGFRVRDRLMILVEAQSTWSYNIIIRVLIYLANTYQKYINENELDVYSGTKIHIPKPELYVIYTGDRKDRPEEISLSEEFFDGEPLQLDVTVKILYGTGESDVVSQYVNFAKIYDSQVKEYGRTREAIVNAICICKDKNIMKEYLENREGEVITMMMSLYDEETIMKNHDAQLVRETTKSVTDHVTAVEREKGIKSIIGVLKKVNGNQMDAVEAVVSDYGYDIGEAEMIVNRLWNE